jgi:hypothetical protein
MSKVFLVRMVFLCHSSDPALHSIFAYAITQCHIYTLIGEHDGLFRGVLDELTGDGMDPTYVMPPERLPPTRRRNDIVFFFKKKTRESLFGGEDWRQFRSITKSVSWWFCGHGNRQRSGFSSPEKKIFTR